MILLLDNYDSFTYNLAHLIGSLDVEVVVKRNREMRAEDLLAHRFDAIVFSPGPGRPDRAGCMEELIRLGAGNVPMLGVCLGHQAIGEVFGAKIVAAKSIMHGKISCITHDGKGVFHNLRDKLKVVRYHSLAIDEATLPDCLEISSWSEDDEIMGIRHKIYPIEAIQYHPESVMSSGGKQQMANFLRIAEEFNLSRRMGKC